MSTLLNRLKEFAAPEKRGSIAAFSRKTGIKDSTARGWFRFGVKKLSHEVTLAICHAYNLNEEWLTYGTGHKYHGQIDPENVRTIPRGARKIPLLSYAQAGKVGADIAWEGKKVILKTDPAGAKTGHRGSFKRLLAYAYLAGDAVSLQERLLAAGHCKVLTKYPYDGKMRVKMKAAWKSSRGEK